MTLYAVPHWPAHALCPHCGSESRDDRGASRDRLSFRYQRCEACGGSWKLLPIGWEVWNPGDRRSRFRLSLDGLEALRPSGRDSALCDQEAPSYSQPK